MRRSFLLVVAHALVAACSSPSPTAPDAVPAASIELPSAATDARAETSTQNDFFPLSLPVWVSCAAGGTGETVELEGRLHVLTRVTRDGTGGFHLLQHFQPQGVSGTGATTGDRYRGVGGTRLNTNLKAGMTESYINNFRIIGQGPGNNFHVHETYHVTVNAQGRVTTERFALSIKCR